MSRKGHAGLSKKIRIAGVAARNREFLRLYLLGVFLIYCTPCYYFGEIVDYFDWNALRWEFLYGVHDVQQRLLFLAPVLYAAHVSGPRGTAIITIVSAAIMMPRAIFVSPYPDPIIRTLLSAGIIGTLGHLTSRSRQETERRRLLETLLRAERNTLLGILERMEDGVAITGPDYSVRFMNSSMERSFGHEVGSYCYHSMYKLKSPCQHACPLPGVVSGRRRNGGTPCRTADSTTSLPRHIVMPTGWSASSRRTEMFLVSWTCLPWSFEPIQAVGSH